MRLVIDTNIFVAAGFNRRSHSAAILNEVREGAHTLVWDEGTHTEIKAIITKIPPLAWSRFDDLFRDANRISHDVKSHTFSQIADPADRKFAALAQAAHATLISNDDHLLGVRDQLPVTVKTPGEFMRDQHR